MAVNHLQLVLSHAVKSSLMQSNPAFFGLHKNCNLSYSKDTTCIKGLRFKPGGREEEQFLKLSQIERVDLSVWDISSPCQSTIHIPGFWR